MPTQETKCAGSTSYLALRPSFSASWPFRRWQRVLAIELDLSNPLFPIQAMLTKPTSASRAYAWAKPGEYPNLPRIRQRLRNIPWVKGFDVAPMTVTLYVGATLPSVHQEEVIRRAKEILSW